MSPRLDDAAGWLAAAHAHLTAALPGDGDEAARLLCRHASELRGAIDGVLARPADAAGLRAVLLGFDVVRHLRLAIERPLAGDAAAEAGDAAEPPWAGALARFYGCPELDRRLAIYAADVAA
ncbi:MAG: hypothetical protein KC464_14090, partial [Myxococcales bacterium]|nr:hypothetical protein [Myxococcales bacterium]